jgi:taurine dioxygenase
MKTWQHISVSPIAGALGRKSVEFILENSAKAPSTRCGPHSLSIRVLFFRDQEITRDQHKTFGRHFGTLQIHPYLQPLKDQGHPEFVVLQSDEQHPYLAEGLT